MTTNTTATLALPPPAAARAVGPTAKRRLNHAVAALAAVESALARLNAAVATLTISERSAFSLASAYTLVERCGDRFAPCGGIPMSKVLATAPPSAAIGRATAPPPSWAKRHQPPPFKAKAKAKAKPKAARPATTLLNIEDIL